MRTQLNTFFILADIGMYNGGVENCVFNFGYNTCLKIGTFFDYKLSGTLQSIVSHIYRRTKYIVLRLEIRNSRDFRHKHSLLILRSVTI